MKKQFAALAILLALAVPSAFGQTAANKTATNTSSATRHRHAAAKIDINSASKEQLMKVEGISDPIAAKIIEGRPYRSKRELLTRKIVNQATYAEISGKIIAHRAKHAAATKAK